MNIELGDFWSGTSVEAGVVKLPPSALSIQHQDWSWHELLHLELTPEEVNCDNCNLSEAAQQHFRK